MQKNIIDLTSKSDTELIDFFKHKNGNLSARLLPSQMNRELILPPAKISWQWLMPIALATLVISPAQAQKTNQQLYRAYNTLSESLTYYEIRVGKKVRQTKLPRHAGSFLKPSAAAIAFLASESKISSTQKKLVSKLCQSLTELKHTMLLVQKFRGLIENKTGSELNACIAEAKQSVIAELKSFPTGLLSDLQSIENAINLHWNNGPVEGNVNKLKTIKRQMYGRASFDLLRKRLVLATD